MSSLNKLPLNPDRHSLRLALRERRRALSATQQKQAARQLARQLARLPVLLRARRIALYWPVDGEIDARQLMQAPGFQQHRFFLPRLARSPGQALAFLPWSGTRRLWRNRFGIPEARAGRARNAKAMDAILMPLTGFDNRGHRLGMGGGFYDRALAFKQRRPRTRPWLIGVAHGCQECASLPAQPWDIGMQWVVTDRARINCR